MDIVRTPLLTAVIDGQKTVDRVEIKEIQLAPHQQSGAHLHRSPVVGLVTEGAIQFQLDGEPARTVVRGEAFFEPANTKVLHFDNAADTPATFVAFYLLGREDHELITML